MSHADICRTRPLILAALFALTVPVAVAQPKFGNASPTAGSETSQQANQSADQAIYRPVEYTNVNKKGPALVVIPGQIKSSNATFLQKFTANNIADFAEVELSAANFPVLERSNLGPLLREFELAYNLGDPQQARKFLGMGKLKSTKYVVKFDILKTEQVAAAQSGFDGRARLAGWGAGRHRRRHGSGLGADRGILRRLDHRHALQGHRRGDHRAGGDRLHRGKNGGRREVEFGPRRIAGAAGWRGAGYDGAAAGAEIGLGTRQQVQMIRQARRAIRLDGDPAGI